MAFPAVMKLAAIKSAMAVMCFMTISFLRYLFGPFAAPGYLLSGACCYARIYCMPMAKQLRTPPPRSHTRICNDIQRQHRPTALKPTATCVPDGIRTDTASIRSVPPTPQSPLILQFSYTLTHRRHDE